MLHHFIGFVRSPVGAIACMALAVTVIGLVVDYALQRRVNKLRAEAHDARAARQDKQPRSPI